MSDVKADKFLAEVVKIVKPSSLRFARRAPRDPL